MADNDDLISQFCAITGAPAHVAENYLLAHDFDCERAVDFYFQHPPEEAAGGGAGAVDDFAEAPQPAPQAAQPDVVEIPDDDEDAGLSELARQRASALAARQQAEQQMEDMMGEAQDMFRRAGVDLPPDMLAVHGRGLAAAAAAAGPSGRPRQAGPAPADLMDIDDEDMQAIAAAVTGAGEGAAVPAAGDDDYGSFHQRQQQQMLAHYQQLARQRQADPYQPPPGAAADELDEEAAAAAAAAAAADAAEAAAGAAAGVGVPDLPLDLPEGINLEEARMLEAAMLGVPYQGRIPDFNAAPAAAAAPGSPGAMEQRSLRAEQDAAYEESLALDRAKQESVAAAAAAAEARQRSEQQAAEAAARAEAEAEQALASLLASKRQRLQQQPEPGSDEPGIKIMVRMPDGSRKGRRFRPSDELQAVFDFVDVESAAGEGGEGGIKPGSYRLVTQFPRKVYVEGSGESLQQAGIVGDSALFIEAL